MIEILNGSTALLLFLLLLFAERLYKYALFELYWH